MNFLLIESLQRFHHYYGDDFKVECPAGSGKQVNTLGRRAGNFAPAVHIFLRRDGRRACMATPQFFQEDPHWRDLILFYEYFNGETVRAWARAIRQAGRRWSRS